MATQKPLQVDESRGFDAHVTMDVDVVPEETQTVLCVKLVITAHNRSDEPVRFTKPYILPIPFASDVIAYDDRPEKLVHRYHNHQPSIVFLKRDPIPGGGSYTWTVELKRKANIHLENDLLLFEYKLKAQTEFQGERVHAHHFKCRFRFEGPRYDRWRFWKEYRIRVRENRQLIVRVSNQSKATVCTLDPFSVGADDPAPTLMFVCLYGFARRWAYLLTSLVSIGVTVVLEWLLERALL